LFSGAVAKHVEEMLMAVEQLQKEMSG